MTIQSDVKVALIQILPQSALLVVLIVIAVLYYERIEALLNNVTQVEVLGISITIDQALVPEKYKNSVKNFQLSDSLRQRLGAQRERMQSARILITKDKPAAARWLAEIYRQFGSDVDIAVCDDESRRLIQRHDYDVIISDISWDQCSSGCKRSIDFYNSIDTAIPGRRVLFYITNAREKRQVPAYALDVTTDLSELIHLTLDILERGQDARKSN